MAENIILNAFLTPPDMPTQQGPAGLCFDFNAGARVWLPDGNWRVQLSDDSSGNILFDETVAGGWVTSIKKYFIPFRITVWQGGNAQPILNHPMSLVDRPVLLSFPVGTLGDLVGWVPYAERFRAQTGARVVCTMAENIISIFQPVYPQLEFRSPEQYMAEEREAPYATYRIGLFFKGDTTHQPYDFRQVGLHRNAGHILGVSPEEIRPDFRTGKPRTIMEPYVCIGTMSTCQAKFWNNKTGWDEVIAFLKSQGYRVLAIDRDSVVGEGFVWNRLPHGAEDFTGNRPLSERIELLEHAEFFIGLGSGLSWLAWGCRIPVVMISGFSLPMCEFSTPWRVINTNVCNGCWDDTRLDFDHHDFLWCPRHKGTARQYECTRFITGKQVINKIGDLLKTRNKT